MSDDFSKYVGMKDSGNSPSSVVTVARRDGMDDITLLRMLRSVFGLSLVDAKKVAEGGDVFSKGQDVEVGKKVYWEGWTSTEGLYVMEATVTRIEEDNAFLTDHKKYLVKEDELHEIPLSEPPILQMRVSYLRKPLGERFAELLKFVDSLANCK